MRPVRAVRLAASRLREADPLLVAVGELLVLPDRHARLEVVDQPAAGGEGLTAVGGRRCDDDGQVTDSQAAHAVHRGQGEDRHVGRHLVRHLGEGVGGTGMGAVVQRVDAAASVGVADRPDEDDDTAGARAAHGRNDLVDRQRRVTDVEEQTGRHGEHTSPLGPLPRPAAGSSAYRQAMSGSPPFGFTPGSGGGSGGGPGGPGGPGGFGGFGGFGGSEGAPFFQELQRLLAGDGGPVNWELARQVAVQGASAADSAVTPDQQQAVREAGHLAELWLDSATALPGLPGELDAWSRVGWVEATLPVWRAVCDAVAAKVVDAMGTGLAGGLAQLKDQPGLAEQLPPGLDLEQLTGGALPIAGMMRQVGGLLFGAQIGSALGGLAGEVIGAMDVGLPLGPPALLPANVAATGEGLEVPADEVRLYLSVRELAAQRLYAHVPWLRGHLLGLVDEYARGISVDPEAIGRALATIDPANLDPAKLDPQSLADSLGEDVFSGSSTPEQQAVLARLETTLALIEGWVDEVVHAACADRLPSAGALRETVRRRRATGGPAEQTFAALVGLELRPRRLRDAAALWSTLAEQRGVDGRDALWAHPDLLPKAGDLDDVAGFLGQPADDSNPIAEIEKLTGEAPKEQAPGEQPRGSAQPPEDGPAEDGPTEGTSA